MREPRYQRGLWVPLDGISHTNLEPGFQVLGGSDPTDLVYRFWAAKPMCGRLGLRTGAKPKPWEFHCIESTRGICMHIEISCSAFNFICFKARWGIGTASMGPGFVFWMGFICISFARFAWQPAGRSRGPPAACGCCAIRQTAPGRRLSLCAPSPRSQQIDNVGCALPRLL